MKNTGTTLKLNTSNTGKLEEYQRLFKQHDITLHASDIDLDEVDADPLTVVLQKSSQVDENILIEDTSLDVEGATIGVHIRWLLDDLPKYENKKAIWTVFLAYRVENSIYVYRGQVNGKIVLATKSGGFGFDPHFMPDGSTKTLAEEKPDLYNARALAIEAFINKKPFAVRPVITDWQGPWQKHE